MIKKLSDNSFQKNFAWNILGTTLNAFNSLFFMVIVTRINGLGPSGIFTTAFSFAILSGIIGGYSGRVFQVTDTDKSHSNKDYIQQRQFSCILMIILIIIYMFASGYTLEKAVITLILCITKSLEMYADVYYGILQRNEQLHIVGKSLSIKAVSSLLIFLIVDLITKNIILSCIFMMIIWLSILFLYDIPQSKRYINKNEKCNYQNIIKITKSGFFIFLVLFLSIYLCSAPKYALDGLATSEMQAIFGIILMPATFISMCAQYILQPFLNRLTIFYQLKDKKNFQKVVYLLLVGVSLLGSLAIIGTYFVGIPLLNAIYSVNLNAYLWSLVLIVIGATFYALSTIFSAALTTMRVTFFQAVIYTVCSLISLFLCPYLIKTYGLMGASIAYLVIMLLQIVFYVIVYIKVWSGVSFTNNNIKEEKR